MRIEEWIRRDNPELESPLLPSEDMATMLGPPLAPSGSDGWPKLRANKFERGVPAVERMLAVLRAFTSVFLR